LEADEAVIKEAWLRTLASNDKGKAREALRPLINNSIHSEAIGRPAILNVGLGNKIDLPLASATFKWASAPEVNPPSPISEAGSVDSNRTIKGQDSSGGEDTLTLLFIPYHGIR
jgi:hypothetical protein